MTIFSPNGFRVKGQGRNSAKAKNQTEDQVEDHLDAEEADGTDESTDAEVDADAEVDIEDEVDVDGEVAVEDEVDVDAEVDIEDDADDDADQAEDEVDEIADDLDDGDGDTDELDDGADLDDEPDLEPTDELEVPEFEDEDEVEDQLEDELELELEDELDQPDSDTEVGDGDTEAVLVPVPDAQPVIDPAVEPPPPSPESADVPTAPLWSFGDITAVAQRALAVLAVLGLVGYGLGALRGDSSIARSEFVYTLDESVPDSFLREDRRLLTQVVTFRSDAVLTPVAEQFDLSVDELRAKIDVQTLDLSEVLRLDVSDADADRAVAISQAVLDQYLQVITDATPAGDSEQLAQQRIEVTTQLEAADAERQQLTDALQQDITLEIRQQSIARRIELTNDQIDRLQSALDNSIIASAPAASRAPLIGQLDQAREDLAALEAELTEVGIERARLAGDTTEPALLREIERLESILETIDDELAQRELGPLVASPIRELSEPVILVQSLHVAGLQGMAIGLLLGLPLAALVAYRTRRRQLWFG